MRQFTKLIKKIKRLFIFEKSVKSSLIHQFRTDFLNKKIELLIYEREIIVIASFLFISSSYLYKKKQEKHLHFDWKAYLKIFSQQQLHDFIICAIKHLLERDKIIKNQKAIQSFIDGISPQSFKDYYLCVLVKKNAGSYRVDESALDFDKYLLLVDECLQISNIILALDSNPRYVVNLITLTTKWKESIFSIFGNKSEYIAYSFFYNINLKL